jgi:hypothetical protein
MPPEQGPDNPQNPPVQDPSGVNPTPDPQQPNPAEQLGQRADSKDWTDERLVNVVKQAAQEVLEERTPPPVPPQDAPYSPPAQPSAPVQDDRAVIKGWDDRQLRTTHRQLLRGDLEVDNPDAVLDLVEDELEARRRNSIRNELQTETRRTQSAMVVAQAYPMDNPTFHAEYQAQLNAISRDPSYANVPEKEMIAANYAGARLGILPKTVQPAQNPSSEGYQPTADLEAGHWPQRTAPGQPKEPVTTDDERRLAARMTGLSGEDLERHLKRVKAIEKDLPDYAAIAGITGVNQ